MTISIGASSGFFENKELFRRTNVWLLGLILPDFGYKTLSETIDCFTHPAVRELDARDLRCPLPLLKAKQSLRDLAVGDVLRVMATDAGSVRDFHAYAQLSGHILVAFSEHDGVYCYLLKKSMT